MAAGARRIWDLTISLAVGMPEYPGDEPVQVAPFKSLAQGDAANVALLRLGTHSGTHVDAPRHFLRGGTTVDQLPWEALLGPVRVVQAPPGATISAAFIWALRLVPEARLLIRTGAPGAPPPADLSRGWPALTAEAARLLVEQGLLLLGLDTASADALEGEGHPVHRALLGAGVVVVERLDLRAVPEGEYELLCLPLSVQDGDGAPLREL